MKLIHWFVFQNDCLVITKAATLYMPFSTEEISPLKPYFVREHYLKHFQDIDIYTAELPSDFALPTSFKSIPLRRALDIIGEQWYAAGTTAYSILNWDKTHQFCGRCGHSTVHLPNTFERQCTQCRLTFYPRISPSVIVLIRRNNELLMARSPHFSPGVFALIAGFVETGESLEQAIHREVKEEVNIKIKNLRYFGSQSWPFPDSLMVGFFADYAEGELVIDHNEIESAGWYRYDNLPGRPFSKISLASHLIDHFIMEQKNDLLTK